MKALLILACTALATFAASEAEQNRLVLVGVFDEVTKLPVAGVKVTASYASSGPPAKTTVGDEAVTDDKGQAILKGRYLGGQKPFFTAKISSPHYQFDGVAFPSGIDQDRIVARSPTEKPNEIDICFWIASTSTQESRRRDWDKKREAASREADRLFREEPDYWPPRGEDPYPWPKGDAAGELIAKRWSRTTKTPLGKPTDGPAIRKVVTSHMKHPKSSVGEVRWIDASTVMVSASWHEGPLASAGYTYVLKKDARGEWQVLTYYMNYVS